MKRGADPLDNSGVTADQNGVVDASGQILTRGQSVCAGYWNKPDATAQTFAVLK